MLLTLKRIPHLFHTTFSISRKDTTRIVCARPYACWVRCHSNRSTAIHRISQGKSTVTLYKKIPKKVQYQNRKPWCIGFVDIVGENSIKIKKYILTGSKINRSRMTIVSHGLAPLDRRVLI